MQGQWHVFPAKLAVGAIAALAALALLAATPKGAAAISPPGHCANAVARDFEAPLRKLPRVRPAPADGVLAFGPGGTSLHPRAQRLGVVLSGNDGRRARQPGYELAFARTGAKRAARLDWIVTVKLARIGAGGETGRTLAWKRKRIRRASGAYELALPPQGRRAKYRVQVVIRDRDGKRLARFAEYFRVMPPIDDIRLTLNGSAFEPGETIEACLENHGTGVVPHDACGFGVQRLVGAGWVHSPLAPPVPCPAIGLYLPPGETTPGGSTTIPADAEPGRYRARFGGATAEFEVVAPGIPKVEPAS